MGYAFGEMADTRVLEKDIDETLHRFNMEFIDSEEAEEWGDVGNGKDSDFTIFEIRKVDIIVDDEYDDVEDTELPLYYYNVAEDSDDELVAVYVCATEEDASAIVKAYYGEGVKAYYREA